jgi:AhpD family alkylhydroperoxidase
MTRINWNEVAREGYLQVLALEKHVRSRTDASLLHLIKLRASFLNGCAHCVDMHTTEALNDGEDVRRVVAAGAWRESTFFNERERVALELTDMLTRIGDHGVTDEVWSTASAQFSEAELAELVLAIATINVWNRVALSTKLPTPALAHAG